MPWGLRHSHRRHAGLGLNRRFLLEWALVGILAACAVVFSPANVLTERSSFLIYDALLSHMTVSPASSKIVIVAIDEQSLAQLGRWPWPRTTHAALLTELAKAQPAAVVFDVLFTEPASGDAELAQSMRLVPTYLPRLIEREPVGGGEPTALEPVPPLRAAAAAIGHLELAVDLDGIVRSAALIEANNHASWPSLTVPVYRALRGPNAPLPEMHATSQDKPYAADELKQTHRMLIPFSPGSAAYPQVSYVAAMQGSVPPEFFRGKVVLVGATAAGLRDRFATPIAGEAGYLPGVNIHATILDALLAGRAIEPAGRVASAWAGVVPLAILLVCILVMSPLQTLLLTVALAGASLIASALMLYLRHTWWSPVPAIGGLALMYLLWSWRRLEVAMSYLGQELLVLAAEPQLLPVIEPTRTTTAYGDRLERLITLTRQAVQRQRNMHQFVWDTLNSLTEPGDHGL